MGTQVLVPVDGSEQADAAFDYALREFPEATLVLLHVINPARAGYAAQAGLPSFSEEWYENAENEAEAMFDEARERAADKGFEGGIETATEVGQPARVIVEHAEDHAIDHVVMGSHGREGITRVLLGSVAEAVVRRSPVPVTVVR